MVQFRCYQMLSGGEPCWALCNLSGGITISGNGENSLLRSNLGKKIKSKSNKITSCIVSNLSPLTVSTIKSQQKFDLFDWISQNLQNSVFCTSNMSQNKDEGSFKYPENASQIYEILTRKK